jgi:hypothetical protein
MPEIEVMSGEAHLEAFTCKVGPVLKKDEFIGVSCLPSIGRLEPSGFEGTQCVIESWDANWVRDSGQVELRVSISAAGGGSKLRILFSLTILATG